MERSIERHSAEVKRITWIGLVINFALFVLKLAFGVLGFSKAIVADAVHTLSDCSTDVAILVGVRFWSRPPDESHPYGHRRIETVITGFIGLVLAIVGVGLIGNALATFAQKHEEGPKLIALAAGITSIVVKEILYRWTAAVGRRIKSSAVVANAWHHRSDALSSIPAAAAVGIAIIYPSWTFIDHLGAILVSFFILKVAWDISWSAIKQLIDSGASQKDCDFIRAIALRTKGVSQVHAIRTRYVGPGLLVDLHVMVSPDMPVREGHSICGAVKSALLVEGPDVVDVIVHLEPSEE
ncbi:MAG: cation transporter [Candidatus Coatesbacteria bacterium]|nr:cation transporter [Candidatus Coatesbacteria bacterium]